MLKSVSLLLRPFTQTRDKSLGELKGVAPLPQQKQDEAHAGPPDTLTAAAPGAPRTASGTALAFGEEDETPSLF